jgi:hypothetical protein
VQSFLWKTELLQTIVLAALAVACIPAVALGIAPNIDAYVAASRAERPIALATALHELKLLDRYRGADKAALQQELRNRIENLQNPLKPYYASGTFVWNDLKPGTIGRLDSPQPLSERLRPSGFKFPGLKVFQVVDGTSALLQYPGLEIRIGSRRAIDKEAVFMVRGVTTKEWVDDRDVTLQGVFAVTGTETYITAGGASRTVPLLELLDTRTYDDKFTRKNELRTWAIKSGNTTDAIFVRHERGKVTLMNLAGKTIDVKLIDLGDADRKYVREKIKELIPKKK